MKAYQIWYMENGDIGGYLRCTLLSYDGDKRVSLFHEGVKSTCSASLIYKDVEGKKKLTRRDLWTLQGKNPKYFKPRARKTTWDVEGEREFSTKIAAIKYTQVNNLGEIRSYQRTHMLWIRGSSDIYCYTDGSVTSWGYLGKTTMSKVKRGNIIKYMKGYGKKPTYDKKLCKKFYMRGMIHG